ncbi:hypothetical protein ACFWV1_26195 [Streptomyces sp. NPDC058700]|uniref:hypothetical protein n=1 Tax=Streptomyces sp. NPDC058700 TaxID=3346607 RepID=UPI003655E4CA
MTLINVAATVFAYLAVSLAVASTVLRENAHRLKTEDPQQVSRTLTRIAGLSLAWPVSIPHALVRHFRNR